MIETETFPTLRGYQFMNLITFRKSGKAVKTPVWFAETEHKLYMLTGSQTGKAKRIRNNARVQVAPANFLGQPLGLEVEAVARILPRDEELPARLAMNEKYGLFKAFSDFFDGLVGLDIIYLEIVPA